MLSTKENIDLMFEFMDWCKNKGMTLEDTENIQVAKRWCIETGHANLNGLELARLTGKEWR